MPVRVRVPLPIIAGFVEDRFFPRAAHLKPLFPAWTAHKILAFETAFRAQETSIMLAFQDYYPDQFSHCFGCGKRHPQGLRLKTFWDAADPERTLTRFTPAPLYSGGVPEHVYGGLIAALFDCHGTASAAAFACRVEGRSLEKLVRYVTASLKVDFLRPTPQNAELTLRARLLEHSGRKVRLAMTLSAAEQIRAQGEMLAVRFRETETNAETQ
jgi:acyl-coenzyme A thioesterase PaaI-like protein